MGFYFAAPMTSFLRLLKHVALWLQWATILALWLTPVPTPVWLSHLCLPGHCKDGFAIFNEGKGFLRQRVTEA